MWHCAGLSALSLDCGLEPRSSHQPMLVEMRCHAFGRASLRRRPAKPFSTRPDSTAPTTPRTFSPTPVHWRQMAETAFPLESVSLRLPGRVTVSSAL